MRRHYKRNVNNKILNDFTSKFNKNYSKYLKNYFNKTDDYNMTFGYLNMLCDHFIADYTYNVTTLNKLKSTGLN